MESRKLVLKDSQSIAEVHEKVFSSFFLTSLGRLFLEKFYQAILKDSKSLAVGIFEDEVLVAFAVGTITKKGFYRGLLRRAALQLIFAALPKLVRNPMLLRHLFQSFFSKETEGIDISKGARLLSIGVQPSMRTKGYGRRVLIEFENEVSKVSSLITLTTDAEKNDRVNQFYVSHGYTLVNDFYTSKRKMNLYFKSFIN